MLQSIKSLGKNLSKNEQRQITGGRGSQELSDGGGFGCDEGTFACFCNFHLVGCYSSTSACQESCKHHF